MRTTVSISDELLAAAKQRAREHGQTLGQVVDAALQRELSDTRAADAPQVPVFTGGTGLRPGVDLGSNRAVAESLDGEIDPGAEPSIAAETESGSDPAGAEPLDGGAADGSEPSSNGAVAQAPDAEIEPDSEPEAADADGEATGEVADQEPGEPADQEPGEPADPSSDPAVAATAGEGADGEPGP